MPPLWAPAAPNARVTPLLGNQRLWDHQEQVWEGLKPFQDRNKYGEITESLIRAKPHGFGAAGGRAPRTPSPPRAPSRNSGVQANKGNTEGIQAGNTEPLKPIEGSIIPWHIPALLDVRGYGAKVEEIRCNCPALWFPGRAGPQEQGEIQPWDHPRDSLAWVELGLK